MQAIVTATAAAYGIRSQLTYRREFVPLVNDPAMTGEAFAAAEEVFTPSMIKSAGEPMTASEDFARFLERVPGCFAFVGNGERSAPLHNASYDFDDEGLPYGAAFHVAIVRRRLRRTARLLGDKALARAMSGRPLPVVPIR
jgi:metal-dependent amidase/aminoacylase/carboxypeptidase family protein